MAHELTIREDGTVEMFYSGQTPWHRLGTGVDKLLNSHDAIVAANLNWIVELGDIFTAEGEKILTHKRTFRKDNNETLGIVGNRFKPFQNVECFGFTDELLGEELDVYDTAGSLRGGKVVWLLAKLPSHISVGDKDKIQNYILIRNAHDGSGSLIIKPTNIRVVCANTLGWAMGKREGRRFTIRHTGNIHDRVKEAREVLQLVNKRNLEEQEIYNLLFNTEMSMNTYQKWVIEYLDLDITKGRSEGIYNDMLNEWNFNSTNNLKGMDNTAWKAYNCLTHYVDHVKGFSKDGMSRRNKADESALFGNGSTIKEKSIKSLLKFTRNDEEYNKLMEEYF